MCPMREYRPIWARRPYSTWMGVYLQDSTPKTIINYTNVPKHGIFAIQVCAPTANYATIIDLKPKLDVESWSGDFVYHMELKNILVSTHGHVMTYGRCKDEAD